MSAASSFAAFLVRSRYHWRLFMAGAERVARCRAVRTELLACASGLRPAPDEAQCREWALRLGIESRLWKGAWWSSRGLVAGEPNPTHGKPGDRPAAVPALLRRWLDRIRYWRAPAEQLGVRVDVERALLACAAGARPGPTPAELITWAKHLPA